MKNENLTTNIHTCQADFQYACSKTDVGIAFDNKLKPENQKMWRVNKGKLILLLSPYLF